MDSPGLAVLPTCRPVTQSDIVSAQLWARKGLEKHHDRDPSFVGMAQMNLLITGEMSWQFVLLLTVLDVLDV